MFERLDQRGQRTREAIIRAVECGAETRYEIADRGGLTYHQVRRQARNLVMLGALKSQKLGRAYQYWRADHECG